MSSQTQSPGSAADSNLTGASWSIGSFPSSGTATFNLSGGGNSDYLVFYGFGFSIPGGATINGVTASISRSCNAETGTSNTEDNVVSLCFNGGSSATPTGSNYALTTTKWPLTDTAQSYGTGTTDLWGASGSLTVSNINSSSFGFVLSVNTVKTADTSTVYAASMTVYYTGGAGGVATGLMSVSGGSLPLNNLATGKSAQQV